LLDQDRAVLCHADLRGPARDGSTKWLDVEGGNRIRHQQYGRRQHPASNAGKHVCLRSRERLPRHHAPVGLVVVADSSRISVTSLVSAAGQAARGAADDCD
jgi:hypothetical protein